jgi:phage tail-like protein
MAVQRDLPYGQYNFLVDLGLGGEGPDAGFEQCSRIEGTVAVAEYRNGNERANAPRKLPGLARVTDVTLRRGVTGTLTLFGWFDAVRDGAPDARRDVTVTLLAEDRTPVLVWRLRRAFPVRFSAGPLNATGSDVAIEELTLTSEGLELE